MNYDKNSFLAGISVGRRLRGRLGGGGISGGVERGEGGLIVGEMGYDYPMPGYVLEYANNLMVGEMGYDYYIFGHIFEYADKLITGEYVEEGTE